MPSPRVLRLPQNVAGRDFVIGDVHGLFSSAREALQRLDFDPAKDRLFSVGDLVDRGAESGQVAEFLGQPFVHAVRGNHEDLLLELHAGKSRPNSAGWIDGAEWWRAVSPTLRGGIVRVLEQLPLAIEVATPRGTVGFIHADVPAGMTWPAFCAALDAGDARVTHTALWGRQRISNDDDRGVLGIGRLFVGHTPQWDGLKRFGNVYAVDTGAVFGKLYAEQGHLTVANIAVGTAPLTESREVDRLDLRDGLPPQDLFGTYAK